MEKAAGNSTRSALARVAATVAAFVLYAILAEALVEVWIFGSVLRLSVTVILLTYAGLTYLLWKRIGNAAKAHVSTVVLLLLLALSVWRLGSVSAEGGLTVLRLSTSTLVTLAVVAALILSSYMIVTLPFLPRAVRVVALVFGLISLTPFVAGLITRRSFEVLYNITFFRALPFWLRVTFVGISGLLPLGMLAASSRLARKMGEAQAVHVKRWRFAAAAVALCFTLVLPDVMNHESSQGVRSGSPTIGDRGPGMRRQSAALLQLPVARTFDMAHVDPAHFTVALGRDPVRIFEYVRDQIAYEAYTGLLRGPRGTLMAMAGNAVDRAALLASLLEHAGQRVRYVRGTLPERDARTLVMSMWADRPDPPLPKSTGSPPALTAAADAFIPAAERDFSLIWDELKKLGQPRNPEGAASVDTLVKEASNHYWVQWARDGTWVDLDPSFSDATPARRFAQVDETLDTLPDSLFHRVTIRVQLEEYTGGAVSTREILTYTSRSAELSGVDVVLTHWPENWKGPADGPESAITSSVENTGRIKPALLVGQKAEMGQVFRPKLATSGVGSIPSILGGEGTRKAVALATAETLEINFISPLGSAETVKREIFDIVGKAARGAGKSLTEEEVRTRTERGSDLTQDVYCLFFTTGRVDVAHILGAGKGQGAAQDEPADVLLGLRQFNILFTGISDALVSRLGRPGQTMVRFYQDSPRLSIAELSIRSGAQRLALDLRRDHARAAVLGPRPDLIIPARILRGVIDGTLERVIMDYVTADLRKGDPNWRSTLSTSGLFEHARRDRIPMIALPREEARLDASVPDETRARLSEDVSAGYVLVAPQRAITVDGDKRFAWWRVNPRSGESVAVTDEGLHQVVVEYRVQHERGGGSGVRMLYREVVRGRPGPWRATSWFQRGSPGWDEVLKDFVQRMPGARNLLARGLFG